MELDALGSHDGRRIHQRARGRFGQRQLQPTLDQGECPALPRGGPDDGHLVRYADEVGNEASCRPVIDIARSEEHTSELQSLMRIAYAVFCLQKIKRKTYDDFISTLHTTCQTTLQTDQY